MKLPWIGGSVEMHELEDALECDFCQDEISRYGFPTRDGLWFSCQVCRDFIVNGRRQELAERAVNCLLGDVSVLTTNAPPSFVRPQMTKLQDHFWVRRMGPPIPLDDILDRTGVEP